MRQILDSGRGLYDDPQARRFACMPSDWPPPGRGLPIGALTSQLFAGHVYLNALDYFVKRELKVPGYVRYMDDFFLFADCRADLRRWRSAVAHWLESERHLRLKAPEARILSCAGHLDALGHCITRRGIVPRKRTLRNFVARLQKYVWEPVYRTGAAVETRGLGASIASGMGSLMSGICRAAADPGQSTNARGRKATLG